METGNSSAREEQTNNRFKPPLWNHVEVVDKGGQGGGNVKWICKYCKYVGTSSYSRVRAHLLKITNGGIKVCPKVTVPILAQLKSEVAKAEDEQAKTRPRDVPLPPSTVGSWITEISEDANMIKNFIMNHGMRLSMFNEFSKLKLLAIAETRFASVVIMLKRFCMVKRALQNMVISDQWETYRDDNRGLAQTIRELVLNDVWWDKVNYIVEFTEPIYETIRVADTDTPCLHLIYEMWDAMIENVKKVIYRHEGKEDNEESTFYSVVQSILIDRWAKGNTPLHCLAHSLNPRYYSDKWINQEGIGVGRVPPHMDLEISQMRMKCFKKFFPVLEDLKKVKEEYARFSTCSGEFNDFDSIYDRWILDPMNWWANHGQSVPVLQSLALKLVNQPASSSCCERNWSTYSFINSMKRNKLTPERAEDLVFVHNNLRLLSRRTEAYKTGATRMWDVGGDSFESLTGVGILEVAQLSIQEPELESMLFKDESSTLMIEEENEDEVED